MFPDFGDLFEAADAAKDLLTHPGWRVVATLLEAEVALTDDELGRGVLDSRADYAFAHGRRAGLLAPQTALNTLVSVAETKLAEQRSKYEGAAESALEGVV